MPHGLPDVAWFIRVKPAGFAFTDGAEAAVARADIAAQHERGRTIGPALENVGALCFLTDRVQVEALDQLEQMVLIRRIAQTNAQPFGLWLTWFLVENRKFAGQSIHPFA